MTVTELLDSWGNPPASHVPPELIRSIEWFSGPEIERDPYGYLTERFRAEPPLFYNINSPLKGQSWFTNRAAISREVLNDTERFSSIDITGFAKSIGENWALGGVEMDPPQHRRIKDLMSRWLNPPAVAKLKDKVDQRARDLVDGIVGEGRVEFVERYAVEYPVGIILEMLGLPREDKPKLLEWMHMMTHGESPAERLQGAKLATTYFHEVIADRQANPRDDLLTRVVQSETDGVPLTADEIMGIVMVLFLGGLDTVVNSLAYHFYHLAQDQELQARLRANPADIPKAINELLRLYPPATSHRMAKLDTELGGVQIKQGDWVVVVYGVVNRDPEEFAHPDIADIDRTDNRHMTFSFGPHFCIGMHLAMRELTASYREWLTRVPPFRLADPDNVVKHGGLTFGMKKLDLVWE